MPKPDGTLYPWERAELNLSRARYQSAVEQVKHHPNSARIYEANEKLAFADYLRISSKYAGCK